MEKLQLFLNSSTRNPPILPNPYSPPSTPADRDRTPWYNTTPADWEKTASTAWVCTCLLLLTALPDPWHDSPPAFDGLDSLRRLLPGPRMVGWAVFLLEIPILSLIPAAVFGVIHWGLMRLSSDRWYRFMLRWICIVLALFGCALFAFAFQGA